MGLTDDTNGDEFEICGLLAYRYAAALRRPVLVRGGRSWYRVSPPDDGRPVLVFLLVWS